MIHRGDNENRRNAILVAVHAGCMLDVGLRKKKRPKVLQKSQMHPDGGCYVIPNFWNISSRVLKATGLTRLIE